MGIDKWKNNLVGYFLNKKLPFYVVRTIAMRIWGKLGLQEVLSNDHGFFLFLFSQEDALNKIQDSGPWFFGGKMRVLNCR